ncbi:hypothetical protein AKJ51_01570 [candidate division MSBL1 archaeon SCGC-AAA382A20]|uniref:Uncharacterized protein n=1 Tax=candidate division MSBL1 archaeon SCGC-AAA382A20 TaxID=1698280 RepID=A0A133VLQ4_9EURY|nr:hypothetical protein AKJ51_01570 [candidate division MSBL1 archaeon SCGC-AAA382A20]
MYMIISIITLTVYFMVIHSYYLYKNSHAKSKRDKLVDVTGTTIDFRNDVWGYENNTYKIKIIYTFEKWMDRMGIKGYVTFKDDNMKYEPEDKKSIPKSKWTTAKIMTALEVMFYPLGE